MTSNPSPAHSAIPYSGTDTALAENTWRFGDISLFYAWTASALQQMLQASEIPVDNTSSQIPSARIYPSSSISAITPPFIPVITEIPLGIWKARRLSAVAPAGGATWTLADLRPIISQLIIEARTKAAPEKVPLYYVLHIGTVENISPRFARLLAKRRRQKDDRATGGLAGRPALDLGIFKQLLDMLDEIRAQMGLKLTFGIASDGLILDATYFEHYAPSRRRRGYLVLDPQFSLLVDCAEEDVRLLMGMIQQAPLTESGLGPPGYNTLLMRVSLWNSNNDILASLDDIVAMNRGSSTSTEGQVLLSLSLAGIGVLLTLITLQGSHSERLAPSLLACTLAAITHTLFAITGKRMFLRVGIFCLLLAMILIILNFTFLTGTFPYFQIR